MVAFVFVVELVVGVATGSLALISDAGHMAADVVALGAALVATRVASTRGAGGRRTYGSYRAEVLASGLAVLLMLGVAVYVVVEAFAWSGTDVEVAAGSVLGQHAPPGLDLDAVVTDLEGIGGVEDVHDLHAWTLTSGMHVVTAHLVVADRTLPQQVLDESRRVLRVEHDIEHATVQVETHASAECHEVDW